MTGLVARQSDERWQRQLWLYDGSNNLLRRYVHGPGTDNPIVWYEGSGISGTTRRFLMADERGSIVSVTDSANATIGLNAYDDHGVPAAGNIGRFGYTGQAWLPEVGLWYYKARMYAPTLGRFMQTDPIRYSDGMNWYNYVRSDPLNYADPSGLGLSCTLDESKCVDDGIAEIVVTAPSGGGWFRRAILIAIYGVDGGGATSIIATCEEPTMDCRSPGEIIFDETNKLVEKFSCVLPVINVGVSVAGTVPGGGGSSTSGLTLDIGNSRLTGYTQLTGLIGGGGGTSILFGLGGPSGTGTSGGTTLSAEAVLGGQLSLGDDGSVSGAAFRAGDEFRASAGRDTTKSWTILGTEDNRCPS